MLKVELAESKAGRLGTHTGRDGAVLLCRGSSLALTFLPAADAPFCREEEEERWVQAGRSWFGAREPSKALSVRLSASPQHFFPTGHGQSTNFF